MTNTTDNGKLLAAVETLVYHQVEQDGAWGYQLLLIAIGHPLTQTALDNLIAAGELHCEDGFVSMPKGGN